MIAAKCIEILLPCFHSVYVLFYIHKSHIWKIIGFSFLSFITFMYAICTVHTFGTTTKWVRKEHILMYTKSRVIQRRKLILLSMDGLLLF